MRTSKSGGESAAKRLFIALALLAFQSASAMAQVQAQNTQGYTSSAKTIAGILLYVVAPILGIYGLFKGLAVAIHRGEYASGVITMLCGIAAGFGPTLLNAVFGVDLSSLAQSFRWGN